MEPGQVMTRWWQDYSAGRLTTPQAIYRAALDERYNPGASAARVFDVPSDGPIWDAPERLAFPGYFREPSYLRQSSWVDWSQVDTRLADWARRYLKAARKRGIPLYVASADLRSVDILHCVFHARLSSMEWRFLRIIGLLTLERCNASVLKPDRLSFSWSVSRPAEWRISRVTP